jgi:hypothetical protein
MVSILRLPNKNNPKPIARVTITDIKKARRLSESESTSAQIIDVDMANPIIINRIPDSLAMVFQFMVLMLEEVFYL